MKRTREGILTLLESNRSAIKNYGVRRLGLFGSWAREEGTETSDLDFVVEFEKKSFDGYMDLRAFLETLFGCRVDLVLENTIKPQLRSTILNETVHAQGL